MSLENNPSDATVRTLPIGKVVRPVEGWLRSVRESSGMKLYELADRMKVTPPAVRSFEQAEIEDRITLASLRRAASAMDCDLVYALVAKAAGPAKSATRSQTPVKPAKPVPPPETGRRDDTSFVTDLTRHTEYGDS